MSRAIWCSSVLRRVVAASCGVSLIGLAACQGEGPAGIEPVTTVMVTPGADTLFHGDTTRLAVVARAASGSILAGRTATYVAVTPAVATVDATGRITAVAAGEAQISVRVGDVVAVARVVVVRSLGSVRLTPRSVFAAPGVSGALTAEVYAADFSEVADAVVTYASSDPTVVTVAAATGAIRTVRAGTATITASQMTPAGARTGLVQVTVMGAPTRRFAITMEIVGSPDPRFVALAREAAARWERVIVGDLPDVTMSLPAGLCGNPVAVTKRVVDDIVLFVSFPFIDGPGRTLGRAGLCGRRETGRGLPFVGMLQLDSADVSRMVAEGLALDVLTHEIGHALGFGVAPWDGGRKLPALRVGAGTDSSVFIGPAAMVANGVLGFLDGAIALETWGGPRTRDAHWSEEVYGRELMTGVLTWDPAPLSAITVGAMADIGYDVFRAAAEITAARQLTPSASVGTRPTDVSVRIDGPRAGTLHLDAGITRPALLPRGHAVPR